MVDGRAGSDEAKPGRTRNVYGFPGILRVARVGVSAAVAIVLVAAMGPVALARSTPSLDGTWGGTVAVGPRRPPGTASGALAQSGRGIKGSLTIDDGTASGVFPVTGTLRGKHAVLIGKRGARRLRWMARYDP